MAKCDLLDRCGFFAKYKDSHDLACRGFLHQYCEGPKQDQCMRRAYRTEHGCPPDDDMLPTGQMMPKPKSGAARAH